MHKKCEKADNKFLKVQSNASKLLAEQQCKSKRFFICKDLKKEKEIKFEKLETADVCLHLCLMNFLNQQ